MISKITGKLIHLDTDFVALGVDAFEYKVLIPEFSRRQLQNRLGEQISLHTIQYLDGNPAQGRLVPRLVGFLTEVEREFFELFCSVDGVGSKKALRAMVRPVKDVAIMIEEQDAKGLATLPGVGAATGERIVAKLRRKMSRFALMVDRDAPDPAVQPDVVHETMQVLIKLGHPETEARKMLEDTLKTKKRFATTEALIQAVYDFSRKN